MRSVRGAQCSGASSCPGPGAGRGGQVSGTAELRQRPVHHRAGELRLLAAGAGGGDRDEGVADPDRDQLDRPGLLEPGADPDGGRAVAVRGQRQRGDPYAVPSGPVKAAQSRAARPKRGEAPRPRCPAGCVIVSFTKAGVSEWLKETAALAAAPAAR